MGLTDYALEQMGFKKYPDSDVIDLTFGIIHIYSLRGIKLGDGRYGLVSSPIRFGSSCHAIVANSVNEASRVLTGTVFADDEQEFIRERNAAGPFVLVYFKDSRKVQLRGGWRANINSTDIQTHDAFPGGHPAIREWEKESLPNIFTSLVVHLSTLENPAYLVPLYRSVFGVADDGRTVLNTISRMHAELYVPSIMGKAEIGRALKKSADLSVRLQYKTSRHIADALNETDRFKQFFSYFMFIERFTHQVFKEIVAAKNNSKLLKFPARLGGSADEILESAKNLATRFHWCALLRWEHIDDRDVSDFLEVKKVRDDLAHGNDVGEADLPVEKAKLLALKLLGTK